MNKKYWITVLLDGTIPKKQVENLIDVSFLATGSKKKAYKRTDMPGSLFSRNRKNICLKSYPASSVCRSGFSVIHKAETLQMKIQFSCPRKDHAAASFFSLLFVMSANTKKTAAIMKVTANIP